MIPVIAITAKTEELRNRPQATIPVAYAKAVEDAGGLPLIIPIVNLRENVKAVAQLADGFIFSGGDDIRPGYYGEEPLLPLELSPDERTDFEIALFTEVLRLKKPVLGICLGSQLINVALGGSLYQDIPLEISKAINHRGEHIISIKEGSLLYNILVGVKTLSVNSAHHQSVKTTGKYLVVCAEAPDGVVEAIEIPDHPFLLGVQWHPERDLDNEYTRRLFDAFVKKAKA